MATEQVKPNTDTPELLACPFCGKESSGQEFGSGAYITKSSQAEYYTVICSACCSTATCSSRKRAVEKWNTRASLAPAGQGEVSKLPDRYILGDAIRRAWAKHGLDSWWSIADDVLAEITAATPPSPAPEEAK